MPRCQGSLDSDCPHDTNDDSVKFMQNDLFSCSDCEEFRFPNVSDTESGNRKGNRKPVQSGAKSKADAHQTDQNAIRPAPGMENSFIDFGTGACRANEYKAALRCNTCQGLFYGECLDTDHQTLTKCANILYTTGWVCAACPNDVRDRLNMLRSGQRSLKDAIEQLKTVVTKLQQEIPSVRKAPEGLVHQASAWSSLPVSKEHKKQLSAAVCNDFNEANADSVVSLYQVWHLSME
jgi:hypothetical protein